MGARRAATLAAFLLLLVHATARAADAPTGAVACSGCHPASQSAGAAIPRLVGRDPEDIVSAMEDFRTGKRPATVMDRIVKGFTVDEVKAIAAWYGAQKD